METYGKPLIKYDLLSVEALDKIHVCLDLLTEQNYIKQTSSLKETYENTIGIYTLERKDPEMWKMIWDHKISSLFQMEKMSGIQGIALVHPSSVDDLATLNSVIRLMAQEKGAEQPLNKFARFKDNIELWYDEMRQYGLTEDEMKILEPIIKISYGICESQERFMELVQIPECGGFDLNFADKLRKSIAKKNPAAYEELKKEYFKVITEKGLSQNLCNYVWNVLVATSKGYGFNLSHTLAYSLIALQEMNLAYKFPLIFWNCACLITDSGGEEEIEDEEENNDFFQEEKYYNEMEEFGEDDKEEDIESSYEEEDCDGYPAEVVVMNDGKKKKKVKVTNYGKVATAIGKMKAEGVNVTLPDINKSAFTFIPDAENNSVIYGLSGITRISNELIKNIIANRPYTSFNDFYTKIKPNVLQTVNLIKSGAFDCFEERAEVMRKYLISVADLKKTINLRNMQMLIGYNLLPQELAFEIKVFNFNKYLKKNKLDNYYMLDNNSLRFYTENFDADTILNTDNGLAIKQTAWDIIYKKYMDKCRVYIKNNHDILLNKLNTILYEEVYNKYASGNLSSWEMDSVSFYSHPHELNLVNQKRFNLSNYLEMQETPEIDKLIPIKGKMVPIYKIRRIAGTILDKDKNKKIITLLTTNGVVTVSIFGQVFSHYDRQISEKDSSGKKHVVEKSWFTRGNKIIVSGIRQGDKFNAKKYSGTPWSLIELITDIDGENINIKHNRDEEE